jgi:hypothetical protein
MPRTFARQDDTGSVRLRSQLRRRRRCRHCYGSSRLRQTNGSGGMSILVLCWQPPRCGYHSLMLFGVFTAGTNVVAGAIPKDRVTWPLAHQH